MKLAQQYYSLCRLDKGEGSWAIESCPQELWSNHIFLTDLFRPRTHAELAIDVELMSADESNQKLIAIHAFRIAKKHNEATNNFLVSEFSAAQRYLVTGLLVLATALASAQWSAPKETELERALNSQTELRRLLTGPQGPPGPKGEQGPVGARGPRGFLGTSSSPPK
ncbi:MAG: hypothetical protein IH881_20375 [Myxococcales bacterium]|nr:hypothetical protein [Myxococcales bacterium]